MKILLPWTMNAEEEKVFLDGLQDHERRVIQTTDPNMLRDEDLEDIDVLVAGIADERTIARCKNLKLIQSMISAASQIHLQSAYARNIPVATIKGANAHYIAEQAFMLMLNAAKRGKQYVNETQAGIWEKHWHDNISGKDLGLIGFGNLGKNICRMSQGFNMQVRAVRKRPELGTQGYPLQYLGGPADIDTVLQESDYVIVVAPKTPETVGLIDEQRIRAMRRGSYLINIARGPLVVEDAVYNALEAGHLRGFATDVYSKEPNDFSHPLFRRPDVFTTPHVGANSLESKVLCMEKVVSNIRKFAAGQEIDNIVPPSLGY